MALIKCPECNKDVSDKAERCIHCGFPLDEYRSMAVHCTEHNAGASVEETHTTEKVVLQQEIIKPKPVVDSFPRCEPTPTTKTCSPSVQNRFLKYLILAIALILVGWFLINKLILLPRKYNAAEQLIVNNRYSQAVSAFENLGNYKDSKKYKAYASALAAYQSKRYEEAIKLFETLGDFKNSTTYLNSMIYRAVSSNLKTDTNEWTIDWKYDKNGNLVYFMESSKPDSFTGKSGWQLCREYTYDSKGNLVFMTEQQYANEKPTISASYNYTYSYNTDGTIKESVCRKVYNKKRSTLTTIYEYQDGVLLKTVCTPDDNSFIRVCEYNKMGLKTAEHYTGDNGYCESSTFSYDRYGNIYQEKLVQGTKETIYKYFHKEYKVVAVKTSVTSSGRRTH